jgi:predicted Fe-Mo cluster-binding NifX family protein
MCYQGKKEASMRIGVVLEDEQGLDGMVSAHFGHCPSFLIVDIAADGKTLAGSRIVPNPEQHGGGGCKAVDAIVSHDITHVIAGGMGMGAQQKFAMKGVKIFGFEGKVRAGLDALLKNELGGIEPCKGHGEGGHSCQH